jgi:uncharacterized repeat protein (TIGR02543 family)
LNGGSGVVPQISTYLSGTIITVAGRAGLTRPGFTFARWKDGSGKVYTTGATFAIQGNIILYAQWVDDGFGSSSSIQIFYNPGPPPSVSIQDSNSQNAPSHAIQFETSNGGVVISSIHPITLNISYILPANCHFIMVFAISSNGADILYAESLSI